MVSTAHTVAFEGIETRPVQVQCALSPGLPGFTIVGLPDKAVSEARERVRAALSSLGLALPSKKITINLSPADIPKEGSHYDLPIALALMAALSILPDEEVESTLALGELALDGALHPIMGALPAAVAAAADNRRLMCPAGCGSEAAWVGSTQVLAPATLQAALGHFTGTAPLEPASPGQVAPRECMRDMSEVKGQMRAKRALEIAAAGRHHVLMVGPPGSGKSMLAARLPGILPSMTAQEALETSMIHSLAGLIESGGISKDRPFQEPHHTASMAAIVGGGRRARPGQISLAHNGVLFMDEFPEFSRPVLETLRQPIETGEVVIARANAHVRYPCRFMLIAAANPCKCGQLFDPAQACGRAPLCGQDYLGRISGPLLDRFDMRLDLAALDLRDMTDAPAGESSANIAARVDAARGIQRARYAEVANVRVNADIDGALFQAYADPDPACRKILELAADRFKLTARGYHRVLRIARTIADLEAADDIAEPHVVEALSYRHPMD